MTINSPQSVRRACQAALLAACLATPFAEAAPFYQDKALAHPVIKQSQESGADIAFIKQGGGVAMIYCLCDDGDPTPRQLDQFDNVEVRSVFYAPFGRAPEVETLVVLLRRAGKPVLRAYRYLPDAGRYTSLPALQPALDRIAQAGNAVNAGQVKAALRQLAPLDYSVRLGKSGIADYDDIDHSAGTVVGYYNMAGQPVAAASKEAVIYKKTFRQKGQLFLTATYTMYSGNEDAMLSNYRLQQVTWEGAPEQYSGTEHGPVVFYHRSSREGTVSETGEYVHGKRHGTWVRDDLHAGKARGAYLNGLQVGPWHFSSRERIEDGNYRNGQRDGRWTVTEFIGGKKLTGFDTYVNGQWHGPHERSMDGVVRSRGNYVNNEPDGPWIMDQGSGTFINGLRQGPWTLLRKDSDTVTTVQLSYDKNRRHGELTEHDANGKLRLREHYNMDVLEGERTRYAANGNVVYRATYAKGKLHGREQTYDHSGTTVLMDTNWDMGKKQGLDARYHANGKPQTLTMYDGQRLTEELAYAENGQLISELHRCEFTESGKRNEGICGERRTYYPDGTPELQRRFQFGQPQEGREWHPNGKLREEWLIDLARDTSVRNTYYDNGQLQCTEPRSGHRQRNINGEVLRDYHQAKREGESICYHRNGSIARTRSYANNKAIDCGKGYDDSGKQISQGPEGCPPPKKIHFNFSE